MNEQFPGQSPTGPGRDQGAYSNASGQPPSVPPGQPIGEPPGHHGHGPGRHSGRRHRLRNALLVASAIAIVLIALGVGVSIGKHASSNSSGGSADSSAPAANASSAAPATEAALPNGGQQYVSDMQSTFNFNSSVAASDIADFGQQVCQDRQSGTSVAGEVPTAQQHWSDTSLGDAIQMITLAEKDMCPSELTAQTVTYVVTGTAGTSVTYGPSGTDISGSVPMSVSAALGTPSYRARVISSGMSSCWAHQS